MIIKRIQEMLRTVMDLFRRALSFAPTRRAAVQSRHISSDRGETVVKLMSISSSQDGSEAPTCLKKSSKLWLHPRATAAALIAYSSVRFHPCLNKIWKLDDAIVLVSFLLFPF